MPVKKFWNWKKRVVNQENGQETEERILFMNGVIAEESWFDDDVTPALFKDELNAGTGDITLWINSPGGDCVAAAQIFNMLSEYPGKVTVKIDGLAASAASVIAMAGTEVWMSPVSMMMIHNPATIAWGDHTEMKKAMELLDAVKESIINAYVRKTGQSRAKLSHLMDAETWMDANKAVELGFADDILFQKEEQGDDSENGGSENNRTENGTGSSDSVMFSRRAVNNSLMNKLEKHYGKTGKSVKDQAGISAPKVNSVDTGRSADDLRERLNFIKKFI
ncbi:head maturation protease, ClpP-related [Blautia glucerasea]|uniref:head maturation protease, ClpP-related n=1 Tax=Blautia glucerasea TaxID=536633 RepID=UPI00191E28BE|nr:head maturation protease, ClpP-related [Blautia glucerasea]